MAAPDCRALQERSRAVDQQLSQIDVAASGQLAQAPGVSA